MSAGYHLQRARRSRRQQVAEVAIPANPAHLGEGKAFDILILIGISLTVIPSRDGIWTYLHHAEVSYGAGDGLTLAMVACPEERLDVVCRRYRLRRCRRTNRS